MKELSKRQWDDLEHRIVNGFCPFCHHQSLQSNPRYGMVGDVASLSVSCSECGHLVFFDVEELRRIADEYDAGLRRDGLR